MELDRKWGFRSSFNFVPEGGYAVSRELRNDIARGGFEVGVHDLRHDGRLYCSRRVFAQKALRINRHLKEWDASGFRSGFMFHKLDWLHDLDIEYDASTFDTDPFEPQPDGLQYHLSVLGSQAGWQRLRGATLHTTARLYPLPSPG